jgi:membrane protein YdbS with pleckstrin-like domain
MKCQQCAAELPEGSAFCNHCGAAQGDARPPVAPFAPPEPTAKGSRAMPPEEPLWSGRYSLRAAAQLWILSVAWIALAVWLYLRYVETSSQKLNVTVASVALLPAAWALCLALYRKLTLRYRLTNHRLFTERGLIGRDHDEIELIRVDDVSVHQNVLQRVFDVGTITVVSTDPSSPRLLMEGIRQPMAVKEQLRNEVRACRARATFLETI